MTDDRYERMALMAAWRLHREHGAGWIHQMLRVFLRVGFVESWEEAGKLEEANGAWERQKEKHVTVLVDSFWKRKLAEWLRRGNSKYGFLMRVHCRFAIADICNVSWTWYGRRSLLKFLLIAHAFGMETGRYARPVIPRNERVCAACAVHSFIEVDDEAHVLDHCYSSIGLRERFWQQVARDHVDESRRANGIMALLGGIRSRCHGAEDPREAG